MTQLIEIFTDGACRGNPGPGGWGAVLRYGERERTLSGSEPHTTNNRMEMMAAIQALEALKKPCPVILTTDSRYLQQGVDEWMPQWKKRNWLTSNRKPVKNIDLWQRLDAVLQRQPDVQWRWVKGHAGHPDNERADRLATGAIID